MQSILRELFTNDFSKKVPGSLRFNGIDWEVMPLGEECVLLQAAIPIAKVNATAQFIEKLLGKEIFDLVPAYESIAVFTHLSAELLVERLQSSGAAATEDDSFHQEVRLPICYELGIDLEEVANHNQLTKEDVIERHLAQTYSAALIGFTPGFIYMDGLDKSIACPRRSNPRTSIAKGSVGIGGGQTGIYSLQSPGGWNIIGRTPVQLFNPAETPPMIVGVGCEITFYPISWKEFEQWEN